MSSNSISQHERHGVWVPASAGTTLTLSPRPPPTTRYPPLVVPAQAGTQSPQGVVCAPMSSTSISHHERHGGWVPASAGTTPMLSPPATLSQHGPRRCMVAGAFLGPYAAIDAGLGQARRDCRAEEKMIEPQPASRAHRFRL